MASVTLAPSVTVSHPCVNTSLRAPRLVNYFIFCDFARVARYRYFIVTATIVWYVRLCIDYRNATFAGLQSYVADWRCTGYAFVNVLRDKLCSLMHRHAPDYLANMVLPVSHLHGRSHLVTQGHSDIIVHGSFLVLDRFLSPHRDRPGIKCQPADIHQITTFSTLKRHFKIFLFNAVYG